MLPIIIDCETCPVRGVRCGECMVTSVTAHGPLSGSVTGGGPDAFDLALDAEDHLVVDRFVHAGLLSPAGAWEVRVVADDAMSQQAG